MTARRRDAGGDGEYTFRVKQSSASVQHALGAVASMMPSHGLARSGRRQRRAPTGGAAYGIPSQLSRLGSCVHRSRPLEMCTMAGGICRRVALRRLDFRRSGPGRTRQAALCDGPRQAGPPPTGTPGAKPSRKCSPISPPKGHVLPWCNHICMSTAWGTDYYK
jgi:hypothetical protein